MIVYVLHYFSYYTIVNLVNSQVDVALECARLQHRLSLPPLEVEDFPQTSVINDFKVMQSSGHHQPMPESTANQTDILQEILSVAHVSQQLINQPSSNFVDQTTWGGNSINIGTAADDFSFMVGRETQYNQPLANNDLNPMRYMEKSWENPITRSIEIGDFEEDFQTDHRTVENLRWIGMSSKDVDEV